MKMDGDFQDNKIIFNKIKWILGIVFLFFSFFLSFYFKEFNFFIRIILFFSFLSLSFSILFLTFQGKRFLTFLRETYSEIRKVIWPTKDESLQTTLVVFLVTTFMALALWGLDMILVYLISFITNLRF